MFLHYENEFLTLEIEKNHLKLNHYQIYLTSQNNDLWSKYEGKSFIWIQTANNYEDTIRKFYEKNTDCLDIFS
jgi:hypothetical protein